MCGGGDSSSRRNRPVCFVFSYLFLILLSAPLLFSLFHKDLSVDVILIGENRNLANAPDYRTTKLNDLPRLWDQYFKDRTSFRQVFMPGYIYVYEKLLKTYVVECVTGYGHEIFANHAAPVIDAALGVKPYQEFWKEHVRLTAAGKHAYFLSKGIPFYLFIAPDKSTLYPEWLPFYASWIPHSSWQEEQIKTLEKAHVNFFPLSDYLWQFKNQGRMFDIVFDHGHWNGNALVHVYDYMAGILASDNPIFRPVPYNEYYGLRDESVTWSVYGSEKTQFIYLKHTDNFSCSPLPAPYRTNNYNKLCINKAAAKGSLWFFSDSYFGSNHGSYGVTPFVHNVHTYIHRHYQMGRRPFTQLADETIKFSRPDAVIEEFAERMVGTQHSGMDSKLRILGDFWMKTGGIFLEHQADLSAYSLQNIDRNGSAPGELDIRDSNRLTLKAPAVADDLGRVVVMGRLNAPSNASVRIFYRDESSAEKTQDFRIAQGPQIFHETIHAKPFSKVSISLQFLSPGKYRLEKIQEIDDLRERM